MHTKERILQTALSLFARDGYEAVSVSQIAQALGITKSAMYKHFTSKRALFDSLVQRMEQNDRVRAEHACMPLTNDGVGRVDMAQLVSYALGQFQYWTEDAFASAFRRMLTVEQFHSDAMQALYHRYLGDGPLHYVASLFAAAGYPNAEREALRFYAPMHLCFSLYDKTQDASLCSRLRDCYQYTEGDTHDR